MVRNAVYAIFGALLGLVMSLVWAALLVQVSLVQVITWPPGQLVRWAGLWILGGLVAGVVAADPWPDQAEASRLSRQHLVTTIPARCGWCRGTGRRVYFFRCGVCGGQGHVLAVGPKKKCAWCQGTGCRFLFRCRACRGSSWLQDHHRC